MLQQPLPDMRGSQPTATLPLQRSHGLAVLSAPTHQPKELQIRVDVEGKAVMSHPIVNGHADTDNRPAVHPDTGIVGPSSSVDVKIRQRGKHDLSQTVDVRLQAQPKTIERQDRINGQLTG